MISTFAPELRMARVEQHCFRNSQTTYSCSVSESPSLVCCSATSLPSGAGVRYGPPGGKRLVYFVDDMNMALMDKYDTQSAIEIMRQSIDYRGWFEKSKIFLKAGQRPPLRCGLT